MCAVPPNIIGFFQIDPPSRAVFKNSIIGRSVFVFKIWCIHVKFIRFWRWLHLEHRNNINSIKTIKENRATRQQCAPGECWHLLSGSENLIGNRCLVSTGTCGAFLSSGNSSVHALSYFSSIFSWLLVTFYNRLLTTGTLAPSLVCVNLLFLEVHNTQRVHNAAPKTNNVAQCYLAELMLLQRGPWCLPDPSATCSSRLWIGC